jgi:hypothetical protein
VEHDHDDREDEDEMDQAAGDVEREEAEGPEDERIRATVNSIAVSP